MEQETELYLIKRIKELESENAHLKGKVKGYEDRDEIDHEIIRERCEKDFDIDKAIGKSNIFQFEGYDVRVLLEKAKAFDVIQNILNLGVANWVKEKKYTLYTTKPTIKKQIEVEIDEETFTQLWGAINR